MASSRANAPLPVLLTACMLRSNHTICETAAVVSILRLVGKTLHILVGALECRRSCHPKGEKDDRNLGRPLIGAIAESLSLSHPRKIPATRTCENYAD